MHHLIEYTARQFRCLFLSFFFFFNDSVILNVNGFYSPSPYDWLSNPVFHHHHHHNVKQKLYSLVEPSLPEQRRIRRSKDEIATELSRGKVLEGGQVIDFSSVKGESRAEAALAAAREAHLFSIMSQRNSTNLLNLYPSGDTSLLLGINEEVIAEVGHPLGTFADAETIQRCASYLRSLAPEGYFQMHDPSHVTTTNRFSQEEQRALLSVMRKAYEESGQVTSAFAKTFYLGTQLLPEKAREAIWAIYVWCRRTDEIVDAPRENDDAMLADLSAWEIRLENLWTYGDVVDVFDLCLLDVHISYPNLEITPFVDMIRGMLMDVPSLGQDRYETFDELHLYCYRVAGTVGLMSMPILGCASGYTSDMAK
jgi:15-cis-phytoene synthase